MPWAYPYKAFYNWNLTGVAVVMAMVIGIFGVKAKVPPFFTVRGAVATVQIDVLVFFKLMFQSVMYRPT